MDWTGKPCPKCAYVRTAADTAPDWQCPRCQIAYAKYRPPGTTPIVAHIADHGRELAGRAASDASILPLLAANAIALAMALAFKMDLRNLMVIYWIQSVIIGFMNFLRIVSLKHFSVEGVTFNDRPIEQTTGSKLHVAFFFLVHYGFFHLIYFLFLVQEDKRPLAASAFAIYVVAGLVFFANHAYSLFHNVAKDAQGDPNIGTLMFLPYARILPMHLVIIAGGAFHAAGKWQLLFGALKTVADVVMHVVEHHVLGKSRD